VESIISSVSSERNQGKSSGFFELRMVFAISVGGVGSAILRCDGMGFTCNVGLGAIVGVLEVRATTGFILYGGKMAPCSPHRAVAGGLSETEVNLVYALLVQLSHNPRPLPALLVQRRMTGLYIEYPSMGLLFTAGAIGER